MTYYIEQHVFSWGDKFSIFDEAGNVCYYAKGEVFSFGKKLHLYDRANNEVAFIHQEVFSFLPRYYVNVGGRDVAEVVKEFTFFHPKYRVDGLGWEITGDIFAHDYSMVGGGREIVSVSKEWFRFKDVYAISVAPGVDENVALAVVLIIDAVLSAQRD